MGEIAYIDAARARATKRAYAQAWQAFQDATHQSPPAEPRVVAVFLSDIGQKTKPSTLRVYAAAISAAHTDLGLPSPTQDPLVRKVLAGHARTKREAIVQVDPIDSFAWERITETATVPRITRSGRLESQVEANLRGLIDVCLIGLMRDAMLRRSEAAVVTWNDVSWENDGTGRLMIRRSKTDQTSVGAVKFVSAGVADTLRALRAVRTAENCDMIFEFGERQICRRISAAARHAGLDGHYAGHSPRIGMTLDLARDGVELPSLMEAGRWKSPQMPAYYIRNITAERSAVAQWYKRHAE